MAVGAEGIDTIDELFRVAHDVARVQMRVECEGARINLLSNSDDLVQLRQFLRPFYDLRPGAFTRPDVTLVSHLIEVHQRRPVTDMLAYVSPSVEVRRLGDVTIHRRPETGQQVVSDVPRRRVLLRSRHPTESALALRVLVRDQFLRPFERRNGNVAFHAAAAGSGGHGVAFFGSRHAGKTTSLLELMSTGEWSFVSADRVRLRLSGDGVWMAGVPSRCNVHRAAIERLPWLSAIARRRTFEFHRDDKALADFNDLSVATGTIPTASAELKLCIFPTINPDRRALEVTPVRTADEAASMLASQVTDRSQSYKDLSWLGHVDEEPIPLEDRLGPLLECILRRVPVIRLVAGFDDYVAALRTGRLDLHSLIRTLGHPSGRSDERG